MNDIPLGGSDLKPLPCIILLGDSITQYSFSHDGGWGAMLADKFQRQCDVINRGFSGYNTRMVLKVLDRAVPETMAANAAAAVVFLGSNDCSEGSQRVKEPEFEANLREIVVRLEAAGCPRGRCVLVTPGRYDVGPIKDFLASRGMPYAPRHPITYGGVVKKVAEDLGHGVSVADFGQLMTEAEDWQTYLSDGLHLARPGSLALYDLLLPHLLSRTSHLPMEWMPNWRDFVEAEAENATWSLPGAKKNGSGAKKNGSGAKKN